ncbi:group-specific protein [Thalassobacillus sp. CUG 92003]|uniref:group-specific protein n=1 Tax=Thalassobacillus sp. CUG 92003 TaxID=2736641 RepID=UPI0015E76179|nr:group-specific protein [Thalassobacillus sp. CUG 92003]
MANCNIDHSQDDVSKKLISQEQYVPDDLAVKLHMYLKQILPQGELNDIFHLLKKYDQASEEEREERNQALRKYVE